MFVVSFQLCRFCSALPCGILVPQGIKPPSSEAQSLNHWTTRKSPVLVLSCFSCVRLLETLWTLAHQSPLSMGFSRQEYWSGMPFLLPGALPRDRTYVSCLLHWQVGSLPPAPPGKPEEVPSLCSFHYTDFLICLPTTSSPYLSSALQT